MCHVRWLLDIPHSPFGRSSRVQTFAHYAVPPFGTHVDCHQRSYRPSGPKLLSRLSVGLVQVVDPGPSPVPSRLNTLNLGWSSSSSRLSRTNEVQSHHHFPQVGRSSQPSPHQLQLDLPVVEPQEGLTCHTPPVLPRTDPARAKPLLRRHARFIHIQSPGAHHRGSCHRGR